MKMSFVGGPRAGRVTTYEGAFPNGPGSIGCHNEAKAVGMFGLYRRDKTRTDEIVMVWQELDPNRAIGHTTPAIDETCVHDWGDEPEPSNCKKCGLSFTRYVHCQMP
jgi:hypothetical protein